MTSKKQKAVTSRQLGCKPVRRKKLQSPTPAPTAAPTKLKIRLNSKPSAQKGTLSTVSAYQFPLAAPPSNTALEKEDAEEDTPLGAEEQGRRRSTRQRTNPNPPDMAFGSEMDNLISSPPTIGEAEAEDDLQMDSSPPTILSVRPPERFDSADASQDPGLLRLRYAGPVSPDIHLILNVLQSSSKIQVDLPDMSVPGSTGSHKPYTGSILMQLYLQCYETQLWHFCDLIADTWIRELQQANKRTHQSKDVRNHMWRKNVPLERIFAEKKRGFKKDVFEFRLDVEDPDIDNDAIDISPERLRELYRHTDPGCGARLLWADAMALSGRRMENKIVKRPDVWPRELFFDVMCTSLRMVGRKLTLKLEEQYEGAWCRYHEHFKHGLPCYRELAWLQESERQEQRGGGIEGARSSVEGAKGGKRDREGRGADSQGDAKRVRFDAGDPVEVIDFGDVDAEGESE